uniref:Uncharacterized protein n=1 Tax=Anolis carolinensis TaxID=28377 RepID=A0A803U0H6_ANOCA
CLLRCSNDCYLLNKLHKCSYHARALLSHLTERLVLYKQLKAVAKEQHAEQALKETTPYQVVLRINQSRAKEAVAAKVNGTALLLLRIQSWELLLPPQSGSHLHHACQLHQELLQGHLPQYFELDYMAE